MITKPLRMPTSMSASDFMMFHFIIMMMMMSYLHDEIVLMLNYVFTLDKKKQEEWESSREDEEVNLDGPLVNLNGTLNEIHGLQQRNFNSSPQPCVTHTTTSSQKTMIAIIAAAKFVLNFSILFVFIFIVIVSKLINVFSLGNTSDLLCPSAPVKKVRTTKFFSWPTYKKKTLFHNSKNIFDNPSAYLKKKCVVSCDETNDVVKVIENSKFEYSSEKHNNMWQSPDETQRMIANNLLKVDEEKKVEEELSRPLAIQFGQYGDMGIVEYTGIVNI